MSSADSRASTSPSQPADTTGIFLGLRQLKIGWFPILLLAILAIWAISGIAFSSINASEMLVGLGITVLAALPSVLWLRTTAREFPAFQLFCLSIFLYYGRPVLAGHPEYISFPEETRFTAGAEVLVFLAIAI